MVVGLGCLVDSDARKGYNRHMISRHETEALIAELKKASEDYYQNGNDSGLTDDEYDAKAEYASTLVDSYPELFDEGTDGYAILENEVASGTTVSTDTVVAHKVPMLSLGKAKTEDEIFAFTSKVRAAGATEFMLQAKLDGFAVSAIYEAGEVVSLATRGDGALGEDATHLLTADNLTIAGLPRTISNKGSVEIRGEIFFTNTQYKAANKARVAYGEPEFKNSRNAVSGLQKRALGGIPFKVDFTFSAYTLLVESKFRDLTELDNNVETVSHLTAIQAPNATLRGIKTDKELMTAITKFGELREDFEIPTDGVVVKPVDEGELLRTMGSNSHHPVSQIAFKYPSIMRESKVLGIDLTVGKTGRVTPVARITPVDLGGWLTSNASLHNFNWVHTRGIRVGATVMVTRANDVIPQIAAVISVPEDSTNIAIPTNCPICNSTLVANGDETPPKLLQCKNYDCASRILFALRTACGRNYLDIDGLSGVLLTELAKNGELKSIADLFALTVESMQDTVLGYTEKGNPRKLGKIRAEKIVKRIELAKTKPFIKLFAGLGIEGLGRSASKTLINEYKTLDAIRTATVEDISTLDNLGEVRAKSIVEGLTRMSDTIDLMIERGVEFDDPEAEGGSLLNGVSFAISGPVPPGYGNRQEWVDFIEAEGGAFHSAPKPETTYMVADSDGTSSKIKKARSLGTKFITADKFDELLKS